MRKYLISLWGSRGVIYQVTREVRSHPLAVALYLLSLLIPSVGWFIFSAMQDIFEPPLIFGGLEFALLSIILLAISLRLWVRPMAEYGFLKRLAIALLATMMLAFIVGAPLNVLSFIAPDSAVFASLLLRALMAAYTVCLLVQIPLSESFNFRVPLHIFLIVAIMTMGVDVFEFAIGSILDFTYMPILILPQTIIVSVLSTFVFVAALTAFSRHFLKMKISEVDSA